LEKYIPVILLNHEQNYRVLFLKFLFRACWKTQNNNISVRCTSYNNFNWFFYKDYRHSVA